MEQIRPRVNKMKIERVDIKNFRALYDVELHGIPPLAVFVGENGSGKSTLFQVFGFLKDALQNNVTTALQKMGGYKEVATRGHRDEPIVIEIKFRMLIAGSNRLVSYRLEIAEGESGIPFIDREILRYKRGRYGSPYHFLDFHRGEGFAISNEEDFSKSDEELTKDYQTLGSHDILAIKGLGQFERFKVASAFRRLIEDWHVSDFHITAARQRVAVGVAEHLSESGDNLPLVAQHLYNNDRPTFDKIIQKFRERIPGMSEVTSRVTEDGHVLLRFQDGVFKDPFIARYVSDGTIKMFAYLVLLHDPEPHPFLCIEEPENQLYPGLFGALVDELREYAIKGGQVFVSTHSPDVLNRVEIEEAFLVKKERGIAKIHPFSENRQIQSLVSGGDKLGWLWNQGLLDANDGLE